MLDGVEWLRKEKEREIDEIKMTKSGRIDVDFLITN